MKTKEVNNSSSIVRENLMWSETQQKLSVCKVCAGNLWIMNESPRPYFLFNLSGQLVHVKRWVDESGNVRKNALTKSIVLLNLIDLDSSSFVLPTFISFSVN